MPKTAVANKEEQKDTFNNPEYAAKLIEKYKKAKEIGDMEGIKEVNEIFLRDMGGLVRMILSERFPTYYGNAEYREDLFHHAIMYCIAGLSKYDPEKGKPSTYFKTKIRKAGKVWIHDNISFININDADMAYAIEQIENSLIERGIEPTPDNVVRESKGRISLAVYQQNKEIMKLEDVVRLDAQTESGTPLIDGLVHNLDTPDVAAIKKERETIMASQIGKLLSDEEKELVEGHFYEELSLAQTAKRMGISENKAKMVKQTAIAKLSVSKDIRNLWGYSDEVADKVRKHNLRKINLSFSDSKELMPDIDLDKIKL